MNCSRPLSPADTLQEHRWNIRRCSGVWSLFCLVTKRHSLRLPRISLDQISVYRRSLVYSFPKTFAAAQVEEAGSFPEVCVVSEVQLGKPDIDLNIIGRAVLH